ncbi:MAG: sigma-54-dependent transcriptional regulator [Pleomorphochaeta sp.]
MNVLLLSRDGHLRTIINKSIQNKCVMISSEDKLKIYIKNHQEIDYFIIDELVFHSLNLNLLFFEFLNSKFIFLLKYNKPNFVENGRFSFTSKPLTENKINYLLSKKNINNSIIKNECNTLIGSSKIMENVRKEIILLAKQNCPIMLIGESGTGKELAANMIHNNSSYNKKKFVSINCALLNSDISDSILFGHRKGSFTGADEDTDGLLDKANDNSLFFDEIENISITCQTKLLRVFELGEYRKIGDNEILKSNFRLICASNRNIEELVKIKKFREDFYYRISAFQIRLPSLNEHKEDIDELVFYYLSKKDDKRVLEKDFIKKLKERDWKGNVRELNSVIEKSRIFSPSNIIRLKA